MTTVNYHSGLRLTDQRIDALYADFSGMKELEKKIQDVLHRLAVRDDVSRNVALTRAGNYSMAQFDFWFSELVRKELGKTLGIIRNRSVAKARAAGAGSASTAVLRRMYKNQLAGNVNIASNRSRISSRERIVPEPTGGKSGIRRNRYLGERTQYLRKLYGPNRGFILRFLENGTPGDRVAMTYGPKGRGSKATWGSRGNIAPRSFFHSMQSDMDLAAQQLGTTLMGYVEKWTEQAFKEIE